VPACPAGNPIINGDFEGSLTGTWSVLEAGDADVDRIAVGGAQGYALRARINSGNGNLPQRIVQSVTVCPGANYKVSFKARKTTTSGSVYATLYVNDSQQAGGLITASSFTSVATIGSGIFSTTSNSVTVRIEFTYGGSGGSKEVQVDDIVLTKL